MSDDSDRWHFFSGVSRRSDDQQDALAPTTRDEWKAVDLNPTDDALGYETDDWESVLNDGEEKQILMPSDACRIREEEFVVATDVALVDLADNQ